MPPKMQYVRLGNSGLKVSKIILGTGQYGDSGWQEWVTVGEEDAIKHVKFAYDHGIQTFDTADVYSNGLSEVILGNAIKKLDLPREELVIMTKLFAPIAPKYGMSLGREGKKPEDHGIINQYGLSRKHIFDGIKNSLKRLQLEYVDVLQCHRFDNNTPIEETMQALHDIVKAGYVRYIGMSSCYAYQYYAINNNLTPFISMQNHYNLLYREEEREMFPTLKMFNVGSIPWSPLARGLISRPFDVSSHRKETDAFVANYLEVPSTPAIISRVEELAKRKGISMSCLGIAWLLAKDGVTAPIIGPNTIEKLGDLLGALDVKLADEDLKFLEELYQPTKIMGHN